MVLESYILINSNLRASLRKCESLWSFPGQDICFAVI